MELTQGGNRLPIPEKFRRRTDADNPAGIAAHDLLTVMTGAFAL